MKLAITGASGFIGSRFLEKWGSSFEQVFVLSRRSQPARDNVQFITGSLADADAIVGLTQHADLVLHCAFDRTYSSNLSGMSRLLNSCHQRAVHRLVHLSSYVVYDFTAPRIDENTPLASRKDCYTREKIALENQLRVAAAGKFSVVNVQPSVVFGSGSTWSNTLFFAAKHSRVKLPRRGDTPCHAIYIDDLVDLLNAKLVSPRTVSYETQIASNIRSTWADFLKFHADVLMQLGHPARDYVIEPTNDLLYAQSKLKNFIYQNSGVFPWNILLRQLLKQKQSGSEALRLDSPLAEGGFEFSGTARMCQSAFHEIESIHPMAHRELADCKNPFLARLR